MTRTLATYAALVFTMLALDVVWLGFVAKPMYASGIGHLMADQPRLGVAALFYLVYAAGLLMFAVMPFDGGAGWRQPLLTAAAFGFFAYATYDLSNWATLKAWPAPLAIADMAWGSIASTVAAASGRWTWLHVGTGAAA